MPHEKEDDSQVSLETKQDDSQVSLDTKLAGLRANLAGYQQLGGLYQEEKYKAQLLQEQVEELSKQKECPDSDRSPVQMSNKDTSYHSYENTTHTSYRRQLSENASTVGNRSRTDKSKRPLSDGDLCNGFTRTVTPSDVQVTVSTPKPQTSSTPNSNDITHPPFGRDQHPSSHQRQSLQNGTESNHSMGTTPLGVNTTHSEPQNPTHRLTKKRGPPSVASIEELGHEVVIDSEREPTPTVHKSSDDFVFLSTESATRNSLPPLPSISDHGSHRSHDNIRVASAEVTNGMSTHLTQQDNQTQRSSTTEGPNEETLHSISTLLHEMNGEDESVSIHVPMVTGALKQVTDYQGDSQILSEFSRVFLRCKNANENLKKCKFYMKTLSKRYKALEGKVEQSQEEIQRLLKEKDAMRQKIKQLERQKDNVTSSMGGSSEGGTGSGWVTVERKQQTPSTTHKQNEMASSNEEVPEEMNRKLNMLKKQVKELMEVNHQWDAHCKIQSEKHAADFDRLKQELTEIRQESQQHKKQEERRQKDIDAMLIASKKRIDDVEVERDEALHQLHMEKQRGNTLNERLQLVERQLTMVRDGQQREAFTQRSSLATVNQDRLVKDLQDQIDILKQQVTIYQDDFNGEREDRERLMAEKTQLRDEIDQLTAEVTDKAYTIENHEGTIRQQREEMQRFTNQLETLREISQQQIRQLEELQQQRRQDRYQIPYEDPYEPQYGHYERFPPLREPEYHNWVPSSPPTAATRSNAGHQNDWNCQWCTYLNPARRSTCEICGGYNEHKRRIPGIQVPTTVQNVQQREYRRAKQRTRRLISRGEDQVDGMADDNDDPDDYHLSSPNDIT